MDWFTGKVVVITGGTSGSGLAAARRLAQEGGASADWIAPSATP